MNVVIERGKTVSFDALPELSIALDGFVSGPQIDTEHHKFSFDHHAGCLRFCTDSAAQQAWTAVRLGLNAEQYTIYANDVDSDVCMAIWCLKNTDRCNEPLAVRLVNAIGLGDRHGGAFDTNGMKKVVEWISSPETESRKTGDYSKISDEGLNSILEAVLHRIDLYVDGESKPEVDKLQVMPEYNILRNQNGWVLAESDDPHAFSGLYQSGFDRIVLMRKQEDESIAYSIAKRSDFIGNFPIPKFFAALNKIEPGWGGGSTIGGAPRNHDGSRSKLPPEKIAEVIDHILLSFHPTETTTASRRGLNKTKQPSVMPPAKHPKKTASSNGTAVVK